MRLAVFGATGRTGVPLVEQALDRGHHVTAFVRDPGKLAPASDSASSRATPTPGRASTTRSRTPTPC
jgi:putative NADH-flavin reductase